MITLLAKIFIQNKNNQILEAQREKYGILCSVVGVFFNILLFTGKFFAGLISGSIAITADAFNNLSDAGSSIITLIGFKLSSQKPDSDHPFGHGRYEYISGLLVSIAIILMAYELFKTSLTKIFKPEEIIASPLIICILIVSILIKFYMAFYNARVGKAISSQTMKATALDSLSDTIATSAVLLCTLISLFFHLNLDGYFGIIVALLIFYTGINAAKETITPLLGQPPSQDFVDHIEQIVLSHPEVLAIHDLIVHDYGPGNIMISLHAEVPADGNILELHDVIDIIEHELRTTLKCVAVIHMDPIMNSDAYVMELKEFTLRTIQEIDPTLSLHDFRIVKGQTHTNLIFDLLVPYKFPMNDKELEKLVFQKINEKDSKLFTVIEIDKSYA